LALGISYSPCYRGEDNKLYGYDESREKWFKVVEEEVTLKDVPHDVLVKVIERYMERCDGKSKRET
jgi:hypothetical protein